MLKYFVSLILVFGALKLAAQVEPADSVVRPPKPPKVKKEPEEFIPTGIRIGVDLNSFTRNLWDEGKTLQEYQIDIDFRHYLLALEYGNSKVEEFEPSYSYTNKGAYFRIGPEINFMYVPGKPHLVFGGLRYASSTLDDQLTYDTEDAFGTTQITSSNDNAKAQWAEMVVGTKINLWKELFIGFTIRYKFLKSVNAGDLYPHWIPGYGENRLDDNDLFGFSYHLWWRIGFRKRAIKTAQPEAAPTN
jgi:hypothetical protein